MSGDRFETARWWIGLARRSSDPGQDLGAAIKAHLAAMEATLDAMEGVSQPVLQWEDEWRVGAPISDKPGVLIRAKDSDGEFLAVWTDAAGGHWCDLETGEPRRPTHSRRVSKP